MRLVEPPRVQRIDTSPHGPGGGPDADADEMWSDPSVSGDAFVAELHGVLGFWKTWRGHPGATNEGYTAARGIVRPLQAFEERIRAYYGAPTPVAYSKPWLKDFVSSKVGPSELAYVQEIAAMYPSTANDLKDLLNIDTAKQAGHHYELVIHEQDNLAADIAGKLFQIKQCTISWQNDLNIPGWYQLITTFGVGLSLGVKFNPKELKKPEVEASPGGLSISIDGKAVAEKVPNYWGPEDLGGVWRQAGGPSVEVPLLGDVAHIGVNLEFLGGSGAPPTPLTFTDIEIHYLFKDDSSKPSYDPKASKIEFSVGSVGGGIAYRPDEPVFHQGLEQGRVPQLVKAPVHRDAIVLFETGKHGIVDDSQRKALRQLREDFDQYRSNVNLELAQRNMPPADPAVHLEFNVVGYASRRWLAARNDAQRLQFNNELALLRAEAVEIALVSEIFADLPDKKMSTSAIGASTIPESPEDAGPILDPVAEQKYREELAAAGDDPGRRAYVEDQYGPKSDVEGARRAEITLTWQDYTEAQYLPAVVPGAGAPAPTGSQQ